MSSNPRDHVDGTSPSGGSGGGNGSRSRSGTGGNGTRTRSSSTAGAKARPTTSASSSTATARRRPPDGSATRSSRPPTSQPEDAPLGESSWRSFFRPVRSSKEGTMPAGMVLLVVVVALVLALFLSADAINRKAGGRRGNAEWRKKTAEVVATFSDAFGLDAPGQAVEDAVAPLLGREQRTTGENNLDELLAEAGLPSSSTTPSSPPSTDPGASVPEQITTTTIDNRPKLPTPTPASPLKMWVGGDSISYDFGIAVENIALESKLFTVTRDSRASTGLTRPDYFNWPENLVRNVITDQDPDVIMVMFGANDAQNIPMPPPIGGYVLGSEEWRTEYRDRVGKTMDLLRSPENDRLVMWVGQPIMGPQSGVEHLDQINYIYFTEAQKRPWVQYFDAYPFFSDPSGAYAKSLPNADGAVQVMRANDNIHLSTFGANRLAWAVLNRLGTILDLSKGEVVPDPAEMPPSDVVERTDIPPGEGQNPYP